MTLAEILNQPWRLRDPQLARLVLDHLKTLPSGATCTTRDIAEALGMVEALGMAELEKPSAMYMLLGQMEPWLGAWITRGEPRRRWGREIRPRIWHAAPKDAVLRELGDLELLVAGSVEARLTSLERQVEVLTVRLKAVTEF